MIQRQPEICVYCGNNPVPHFLYWYNESANILLGPLRRWLFDNIFIRRLKKNGNGQKIAWGFFTLGRFLKIVSWRANIEQCKVKRAQVLWQEAQKRGINMVELLLLGRPFDCYLAVKSAGPEIEAFDKTQIGTQKKIIFSGLPRPAGFSGGTLDLMDDKWLFKKNMMAHGLPVALGGSARNFSQAKKIFENIQDTKYKIQNTVPVIVKPRTGSRGRHSNTFVLTADDLKRAVKIAKQLCYWVVVEEQLFGPVYRATLIDFKLCGVLRGDPPSVTGDGVNNLERLIVIKNLASHEGVKDVVVDDQMRRFVTRQLFGLGVFPNKENVLHYIPAEGETFSLSEKIGVNYGGSSSEDIEICHPDNKELFIKAAKALGSPIVGFDFIIPDIKVSWKNQKCGFIEANSLPFINLHHDPLHGQPQNVAAAVWEMMGM